MKKFIVTVDGPAASGKQKIAKYISKKWNLSHLDSGILYRRIALIFSKNKINLNNYRQVNDCLSKINNAEVKNQIIVKIIDKYLNFFTFKG